jgi:hypothetical protein
VSASPQDTLVIDPVQMNIVNRVAEGCDLEGCTRFVGGLLLQGTLRGEGEIEGRLVVWPGARLEGRYRVWGELYVLGQLGRSDTEPDPHTHVECLSTVYVASSGLCSGHLSAPRLHLYEGATLLGPFRTLRPDRPSAA